MRCVWWHVPRIEACVQHIGTLEVTLRARARAPWPTWTGEPRGLHPAPLVLIQLLFLNELLPAGKVRWQQSGFFLMPAKSHALYWNFHNEHTWDTFLSSTFFFYFHLFFLVVETCRIGVAGGGGLWTFRFGEQWFNCCLQNKKRFKF